MSDARLQLMPDDFWDYRDSRLYLKKAAKTDWPPLIITVAITGGIQGKEVNPSLPETPEEQADQAYDCYRAGASIVHVHARDPTKGYADTSGDPQDFRRVNALIRDKCPDIIINNTTGGSFGMPTDARQRILEALPEMATLNCGPNPVRMTLKKREAPLSGRPADIHVDGVDLNTPSVWKEMELFANIMLERDIKPEVELYSSGQFWLVDNLVNQELLKKPYFIQLVMGVQGGTYHTPKNLLWLSETVPQPCLINVAGVGPSQLPLNTMAIMLGLHARTGLEDNTYYRRGEFAKNNAQLVERVVRIAKELNREIATPTQARQALGISVHPRKY
jgi:3-keto-5-aminohexanoate cleavage enzyme